MSRPVDGGGAQLVCWAESCQMRVERAAKSEGIRHPGPSAERETFLPLLFVFAATI